MDWAGENQCFDEIARTLVRSAKRTAQERGTHKPETPGHVFCLRNPDAWTCYHMNWLCRRYELKRRSIDRHATLLMRYPERLANTSRPRAEEAHILQSAAGAHHIQSGEWFDRANQNSRAMSFRATDKIKAPVDSVGTVDIGSARRSEHHLVTLCRPAKTVGRRIFMVVRFCFYNPAANAI